jgi:hypothetical protein
VIRKVVTGGQTGADQAGWRAARAMGIPTGGYMPLGWHTEDGPMPGFGPACGAQEWETSDYRDRTEANVKLSDVVIWIGHENTPGAKCTRRHAGYKGIPFVVVPNAITERDATSFASLIRTSLIGTGRTVMVAGNRESSQKGIGRKAERVCLDIFRAYNELEKRR